jgi:F-type H+-transporting ATPase subunit epsilon
VASLHDHASNLGVVLRSVRRVDLRQSCRIIGERVAAGPLPGAILSGTRTCTCTLRYSNQPHDQPTTSPTTSPRPALTRERITVAKMLDVELVAADRLVWSGRASIVSAKTVEGEIGIMADHEPLLSVLKTGPVTIRSEDAGDIVAAVHGGFISVAANRVTILAEVAELPSEIDVERARVAEQNAGDDVEARSRAETRLRVAQAR